MAEEALDGEDIAVGGVGGGGEAVSQAVQVPSGWESSAGEFRGPSRADVSTVAGGECPAIGTCVAAGADEGVELGGERDGSVAVSFGSYDQGGGAVGVGDEVAGVDLDDLAAAQAC